MALPLPKVVADTEAGGGLVTSLKGLNALQKSNLENQYYGPTQQANIASKSTYARYLPAQILGQVLANPIAWQTMPKEQLQALVAQYGNAMANPPSLQSLSGQPTQQTSPFAMLMNKLQGNNQPSQNALTQPPIAGGGPSPGTGNALVQPTEFGANNRMSDAEVNHIANFGNGSLPNTAINRIAPTLQGDAAYGGINPMTANKAQAAGLEATATGEAAAQTDLWKETQKNANSAAEQAQANLNLLDKLEESYGKLNRFEKGPIAGKIPAFSEAASDVDKAQAGLADSVARAQQEGHITQADRATYGSMKPSRDQPGNAFKHQILFNRGMNERVQEKPAFLQAAQEHMLNPTQTAALWTAYISQRPFYNAKKNEINEKNLGSWEDFFTPKKFKEAMSPKARKESSAVETENLTSESGRPNTKPQVRNGAVAVEHDGKRFVQNKDGSWEEV